MGEPPTQAIPPVPATPAQGVPITREELHARFCFDCPDREACQQGAPCGYIREVERLARRREYEIELHREFPPDKSWVEMVPSNPGRRGSGASVSFLVFLSVVVAAFALVAGIGMHRVFEQAHAKQREWSTRTEMDWTIARMADRDLAEACRGTRSGEWRTDTIDRFYLSLNKNFADGPVPDRNEITAYLDRMCRADGWGRLK